MNIYNIPAQHPFSKTLVDKLFELHNGNVFEISNYLILLPSRRACKNLKEAFLAKNDYKAMLLPSIYPLGEVDEDEVGFNDFKDNGSFFIESAISPLEQRILLSKIIREYYTHKSVSDSIGLAIELQSFLAETQKEKIDLNELDKIFPENLAEHWQKIVDFLKIVAERWPEILKERNLIDQISRRNKIIEEREKLWRENPPSYPVIAAGSTGSLPSTSILLKTIASLSNGKVILPGLDPFIDDISWDNLDEFHPQFTLKKLLNYIGVQRSKIENWLPKLVKPKVSIERSKFLSEVMRPVVTSHEWLEFKQLELGTLQNISWINLDNMQQEANVVSIILREVFESDKKTAALVTADEGLAKRVSELVKRWNIEIDYSEGENLIETGIGVFLQLIIDLLKSDFSSVDLLALFKHPLTNFGFKHVEFKNLINDLEISMLRGLRVKKGIKGIRGSLKGNLNTGLIKLIDIVIELTNDLVFIFEQENVEFDQMLDKHLALAQKIHNLDDSTELWNSSVGKECYNFFLELKSYSKHIGKINPQNYNKIFANLLLGQIYPKPHGMNPRVAILNPIEARMHNFDLIIMGGLNEGTWPKYSENGPWMSRSMRKEIGLPAAEKKIGQAAHDFYMLAHADEVIFTRSIKVDGTLTVSSRFMQRFETVLKSAGVKTKNFNVKPWLRWVELLNMPDNIAPIKPPEPKPEAHFRPTKFSVTEIEKLIRNPYSIYASKILKLKPIDQIDEEPKARDFGNFIHKSLELFTTYDRKGNSNDYEILIHCGKLALGDLFCNQIVMNMWWPKFERIVRWLLNGEHLLSFHKVYSEVKALYEFSIADINYILTTKADRIEIDPDNNISIIDYKTGSLPTNKNISNGIASQMVLEAMIAKNSCYIFQIKDTIYNIADLKYIRLSGGEVPGEIKKINKDVDLLIKQAHEGLRKLLVSFSKRETPYLYCPNPELIPRYNDYNHLARVLEWLE